MRQISWWLKGLAAGAVMGIVTFAGYYLGGYLFPLFLGAGFMIVLMVNLECWHTRASSLDNWSLSLLILIILNCLGTAAVGFVFRPLIEPHKFEIVEAIGFAFDLTPAGLIICGLIGSLLVGLGEKCCSKKHYFAAFTFFAAISGCHCLTIYEMLFTSTLFNFIPLRAVYVFIGNLLGILVFAEISKLIESNLKSKVSKLDFSNKMCYNNSIKRERKPTSLENTKQTILKENSKEIKRIMANVEKKEITITEKGMTILAWMQEHDNGEEGYFGADIAEAVGFNKQGIHGVMNALVKAGMVQKATKDAAFESKDGKKGVKPYTVYSLTEAGRAYRA